MIHIQRVFVRVTIAHAQMQIDSLHNIGTNTPIETELHIQHAQRRIEIRRNKWIIINDIAETQ